MIKLFFLLIIALSTPYVFSSQSFGLFPTSADQPPLELLKLETTVKVEGESYAKIQYTFLYKNPFENSIQTKFVLPPTRNAIFHKFEATIQNKTFTSKIAKKPAEPNNCDLGGFPTIQPNETVHIVFIMIQPLQVVLSKFYELKLLSFINNNDIRWNIQIELESIDEFVVLSNPTHRLIPQISEQDKIHRAFWNVTIPANKEFAVYFGPEDLKNYTIRIPDTNTRLYNFIPNIESVSAQQAQNMLEKIPDGLLKMKKSVAQSEMQKMMRTCSFVIDRSDSMKGSPIQLLKKALKVLLRDLAPHCRDFHIISFGSTFEHHKFGFEDIQEAIKWVDTIEANMGGSDLLKALRYTDGLSGDHKVTMIMTDGDVSEPHQIQWTNYFVLGVGEASKGLIKRVNFLWRHSNTEFVVDHEDFGDQEVINMLHRLNPIYSECAFTFTTTDGHYQNQPFLKSNRYWYPFSEDDAYTEDLMYFSKRTNLKICDGHRYWDSCQFGLTSLFSEEDSLFEVHTKNLTELWHKIVHVDKINQLEEVRGCCEDCDDNIIDKIQQKIINLSIQHQILHGWTSLVLQTKSDVCNGDSSEFFDLSKFNKPNQSSEDGSLIFNISEDYVPFDSIQNAEKQANDIVANQIKPIDL